MVAFKLFVLFHQSFHILWEVVNSGLELLILGRDVDHPYVSLSFRLLNLLSVVCKFPYFLIKLLDLRFDISDTVLWKLFDYLVAHWALSRFTTATHLAICIDHIALKCNDFKNSALCWFISNFGSDVYVVAHQGIFCSVVEEIQELFIFGFY